MSKENEFHALGLGQSVLKGVEGAGYQTPSDVQTHAIPPALEGKDLTAQARTGTGKTAAFGLPMLENLSCEHVVQGLIITPTRELANQVACEIEKLGKYTEHRCLAVYGGTGMVTQTNALRAGVDIVIGTPGRLIDHIERRNLKLGDIKMLVLDEADRMLDMGFRPDIERMLSAMPRKKQTMLFSATFPSEIMRIATKYMDNPIEIRLSEDTLTVENVDQKFYTVTRERKGGLLEAIIREEKPRRSIVFVRTKNMANRLLEQLRKKGINTDTIHGDLAQSRRERVLAAFRKGKIRTLIATDVAARGLDIPHVTHVINYDIPEDVESYVHRVGRTARMDKTGCAITLVSPGEGSILTDIEMTINKEIPEAEFEGFNSGVRKYIAPSEEQTSNSALFASPGLKSIDLRGLSSPTPEKPKPKMGGRNRGNQSKPRGGGNTRGKGSNQRQQNNRGGNKNSRGRQR